MTVASFRNERFFNRPKTELVLGPFRGGINKTKDPNFLSPYEMQECINYIVKPDGRLVGRPPVTLHNSTQGLSAISPANAVLLGSSYLTSVFGRGIPASAGFYP